MCKRMCCLVLMKYDVSSKLKHFNSLRLMEQKVCINEVCIHLVCNITLTCNKIRLEKRNSNHRM